MCIARTFAEPFNQDANPIGSLRAVPRVREWHALEADIALTRLGADPARGLTAPEVAQRHLRYGLNALQEIRPRPAWRLLLDQFKSIVIALFD